MTFQNPRHEVDPHSETCGTCTYMDVVIVDGEEATEDRPDTICRRHPPVHGWPLVLSDDWCGDWEGVPKT